MNEKVDVEVITEGSAAVVVFKTPSISNIEEVASVSRQIKEFVDENRPSRVVFDFEFVRFFSSQLLGLLLDIRAKIQKYNGEVVISAINPRLHRVFQITNLDKVFKFFPDKESATRMTDTG